MRKYVLGLLAFTMAYGLSAFTAPERPVAAPGQLTFDWYAVSYSVPIGIIPAGAPKVFDNYTQPAAQAADNCLDLTLRHCLRGFAGVPPGFPTSLYDASTPRNN